MTAYFFDLDGTLCDSRPGLIHSFHAAFQALGMATCDDHQVDRFLGTPLPKVFRQLVNKISDEDISAGIAAFRHAFETAGMFQTPLYPGALPLLQALHAAAAPVWLVTLKPQPYAETILANLGISGYFDGIVGAGMDESDTKAELIAVALRRAGVSPGRTLMLGDRAYDVAGALANGVVPIGALWGYGSRDELAKAGCSTFCDSLAEFKLSFFDQHCLDLDIRTPATKPRRRVADKTRPRTTGKTNHSLCLH